MPASAVLASRADTPTRSAPAASFNSAQRPVASSPSSQPAISIIASARPLRRRRSITSLRRGGTWVAPSATGQISAIVSARSPT